MLFDIGKSKGRQDSRGFSSIHKGEHVQLSLATEQREMSTILEEPDGEKTQNQIPDLLKRHDRVKSITDNTAVRPNETDISIWKLFEYADSFDMLLMAFGTAGAIADGITTPMAMLVLSSLIDTIGNFGSSSTGDFSHSINTVIIMIFFRQ